MLPLLERYLLLTRRHFFGRRRDSAPPRWRRC